jgi:hypothetical protein
MSLSTRTLLPLLSLLLLGADGCTRTPPTAKQPPGPDQLPAVPELPDPFRMKSGRRVESAADWRARRGELRAVLLDYAYGHAPPAPARVDARTVSTEELFGGKAQKRLVRLTLGPEGRVGFLVGIIAPRGKGPFAAIVHIDHRMIFGVSLAEELVGRGYLIAGFNPTDLAPDRPGAEGPIEAAYPGRDARTLAIWAWGASRVLDHLLTLGEVDRARVVVTGHSRSGKAALLAGALDERFALVAPQGSGTGGAASYRFRGEGAEGLGTITRSFPHWFLPVLARFDGREDRLPFDQHFLLALVAPRGLLSIDALGDAWANPLGTQQAHLGARPVFELLGAADRIGLSFRQGEHALLDEDWRTLADFADELLYKKPASGRLWAALPFPSAEPPFRWTPPRPPSSPSSPTP